VVIPFSKLRIANTSVRLIKPQKPASPDVTWVSKD
jgi:hypothetical protein